jgi:hypothetical protein
MVAELLPMFHQQETVNESVFCLGSSRVKKNGTQPLFVCPEDIFFGKNPYSKHFYPIIRELTYREKELLEKGRRKITIWIRR